MDYENTSVNYMLRTAFDYEIRNYIDVKQQELNKDEYAEELHILSMVREYLIKRMGEMKS